LTEQIQTKKHQTYTLTAYATGRVGVTNDVAQLCLFLADGKKSGFITGQEFTIDGGVSKKLIYPE
jgi:NAD(P)-dependent dehydrogenase (short-subunit alcohol dehydrogenase family)